MDRKVIGERLHSIRQKRGLTMRQLADKTGISQGQISRLENGRQGFRSDTLLKLSNALGVEPYVLYMPEPTGDETAAPQMAGNLGEALRHPDFVALAEEIARAYLHAPHRYRTIENVIEIILRNDHASEDMAEPSGSP